MWEWVNGWISEWMSERINDWVIKWVIEMIVREKIMNGQTNAWVDENMNKIVNE